VRDAPPTLAGVGAKVTLLGQAELVLHLDRGVASSTHHDLWRIRVLNIIPHVAEFQALKALGHL
jgi:hypothetical protein